MITHIIVWIEIEHIFEYDNSNFYNPLTGEQKVAKIKLENN